MEATVIQRDSCADQCSNKYASGTLQRRSQLGVKCCVGFGPLYLGTLLIHFPCSTHNSNGDDYILSQAFTEDDWKLVQLVLTLLRNILAIQDIPLQHKAGESMPVKFSPRETDSMRVDIPRITSKSLQVDGTAKLHMIVSSYNDFSLKFIIISKEN
ncbi:hypothetical protein VitviT2T_025249 [Vitis vinifera]|uniref:Timeless N-terminal domain-containing protein n=1 Tax=Vitis vinifera TaxID=29760 RepID=A0ABY9DI93_VITVI|nr:hypothetical protein VitviT2T_025249 [Vitis vinifera]